ncbi:hypothetical protein JCM8097_002012 [Rhodosporidiobolus ruineniae]
MARDRLAAIRARQALNDPPSAPQPSASSGHARGRSDPYDGGAPRDFNPYAAADNDPYGSSGGGGSYSSRPPPREEPRLPGPGWHHDYSVGGGDGSGHMRSYSAGDGAGGYGSRSMTSLRTGHSRSSSTGTTASRRYLDQHRASVSQPNYDEYPVPPLPVDYTSSSRDIPQDFTTPPLATTPHLHSPPEEAPPRDFDPNDSRSHYAMGYMAQYGTPPQQARHETQYVPAPPRQTRQRSVSGGQRTHGGARRTSIPIVPVPPVPAGVAKSVDQDSYGYEDKASTVDLVERDDYERRPSTMKKGGGAAGTVSKGQVPFEEMSAFFNEISSLQQTVREANGSIQSIGDLHNRSLAMASSEDAQAIALNEQLTERSNATRALFADLRNRLGVLEQGNANLRALIPLGQSLYDLSLDDVSVREQQVAALKERVKDAIQRYAEVERDNRAKQRAKLERQVKVVNPTMTPFEVSEVVKQAEAGGDNAMFNQALSSNGFRSQAARSALREAQNRAADLARIEETLVELAQLFQDMAALVYSQDVAIVNIEQNAIATEKDMEKGLGDVKQAVVHARNARKYRWWCFWIILIIIAIVLIAVGVTVIKPAIEASNRNNNNAAVVAPPPDPATTPAPAPASTTTPAPAPTSTTAAPVSTSAASSAASSASSVASSAASSASSASNSAASSASSAASSAASAASSAASTASTASR